MNLKCFNTFYIHYSIAATTPELIVGILNSVFFKFLNFLNIQ